MRGDNGTPDRSPARAVQDGGSQDPRQPENLGEVNVTLRKYDPETDEGFIYSSWRNGLYYHTEPRNKGNADRFFREASQQIRRTLKAASVSIACLQDSPVVIVGYLVLTGTHLDWIYVKEDFRTRGIGRLLCARQGIETVTSDVTRTGSILVEKFKLKTFKVEPGE